MGIKLLITAVNTKAHGNVSTLELDGTDITIGCSDRDSAKLDANKLQGCRARISARHDADTGRTRLLLANLSESAPIILNHSPLLYRQESAIDGDSNFQLGDYLISAIYRATTVPANDHSQDFSLDSAIESLLRPLDEEIRDYPQSGPSARSTGQRFGQLDAQNEDHAKHDDKKAITDAKDTQAAKLGPAPHVQPSLGNLPAETARVAPVTRKVVDFQPQNKPLVTPPDSNDDLVTADSEQTLFDGTVGVDDIPELDFDAIRLFSIRGRISHHDKPLAGMELDGGILGTVFSDANGCFSFNNIIEGTHFQIDVKHDGYQMHGKDALFGILTKNVEAKLGAIKLSRVSGRITHSGQALAGVRLDAGEFGTCISDDDGYYHFDDVPENTHLTISANGTGFSYKRKYKSADNAIARNCTQKQATQNVTSVKGETPDPELESSVAQLLGKNRAVA